MSLCEIRLWDEPLGYVSLLSDERFASFEYEPSFIKRGLEIAPFTMPLSEQVYTFPTLALGTFHGLPGLLADSLPDKFGNELINAWLAGQGRLPESFDAVERLCYTGTRGMGALEFRPAKGPGGSAGETLSIEALVKLASEV